MTERSHQSCWLLGKLVRSFGTVFNFSPPDRELRTFPSCSTFFTKSYPFLCSDQYALHLPKKSLFFPICDSPQLHVVFLRWVSALSWWTALKFQLYSVNMPSHPPPHTHSCFLTPSSVTVSSPLPQPTQGGRAATAARRETQTFCSLLKRVPVCCKTSDF